MSKVKKVTRSASPDSSEDSDDSELHKHVNSLRSIMTPDRDFSKSRPFYAERSRTMDVSSVMAIQEHARPRQGSSSSRYVGKVYSLTTSIERFRSEFDDMKQKMAIFGESLNLCKCIAVDFNTRVSQLEKRLDNLERRQCSKSQSNNYSHIIKKNKELSTKTLNEAKGAPARVLPFHPDKPYQDGLVEPEHTRRLPDFAPQKLQMCGTEDEMREVAGRICRNYLPGAWKTVGPTDLQFHRISGGLSNFLYFVALPEDLTKVKLRETTSEEDVNHSANMLAKNSYIAEEPKQVLIRIYGQVHGERAMDAIVTESVIFTLLSERKLGPKLYGVFSGGRIEEYIPARPLITKELSEPALSMKIAEKMAAIHSMDIPLSKEPSWLWKTLSKWLKTVKEERLTSNGKGKDEEEARLIKRMNSVDYGKEIEWLKKFLEGVESPAVFCHNDMQEGNILFLEDHSMEEDVSYRVFSEDNPRKSFDLSYEESTVDSVSSNLSDLGEPKLYLIDFEYCSYNYRGFDIANHFQEWAYNYTNPEYPYFYETPEDWPTLEQKEIFIREYLKHFNTNANDGKHTLPTIDEVNHLLNEVDAFALASHLFWSLWSIINASKSQIPFGYWNYGVARLDTYLRLKQEVVKKDKFGPQKRKICEVDI